MKAVAAALLLLLTALPGAAPGQEAAAPADPADPADPAAVADRFMRTLARGDHAALGALIADRVATGEGQTLRRDQLVVLYQGYTMFMFGPLRAFACAPPAANAVTCTMRFQSRSLRERYTIENGLISRIEILSLGGARS